MAEVAYRALEEMIVTRRLRPASMISENQLSEQLGCGRTPIREALKRLERERLVVAFPRTRSVPLPPQRTLSDICMQPAQSTRSRRAQPIIRSSRAASP